MKNRLICPWPLWLKFGYRRKLTFLLLAAHLPVHDMSLSTSDDTEMPSHKHVLRTWERVATPEEKEKYKATRGTEAKKQFRDEVFVPTVCVLVFEPRAWCQYFVFV